MTASAYLPGADHTSQDYSKEWPGDIMPHPNTLVWHSTESGKLGWPSYDINGAGNGSGAPTFTYDPARPKGQRWRQHFPANMSARGLVHTGDPATNTLNVIQVEIVGTCNPAWMHNSAYTWVPGLVDNDDVLDDLATFAKWCNTRWSVPLTMTEHWKAYPASYGPTNGVRFTGPEWVAFSGHCAHEHAPENVHGDIGDGGALIAAALKKAGTPDGPPMSMTHHLQMLGVYDVLTRVSATMPGWKPWVDQIRALMVEKLGPAPAPGSYPVVRGVAQILAWEHAQYPTWTGVGDALNALESFLKENS